MAEDYETQVKGLLSKADAFGGAYGNDLCKNMHDASLGLLHWLKYLHASEKTGVADNYLEGMQAAIVEAVGCVSIGFVRPTIFALRAEIDILLSWLYFKDHPVELKLVETSGRGFRLKSEILGYLDEVNLKYKTRFGLLAQTKKRQEMDPYRILSAHVHSQSSATLPLMGDLSTLVSTQTLASECVVLQREVAEYLGDILMSVFADKVMSMSVEIINPIKGRLNPEQTKAFFQ